MKEQQALLQKAARSLEAAKRLKSDEDYLIRSQNQRLAGDYNYVDLPSAEDAELQIDRAKEFLDFAEQYLTANP